jgi:hypothetical protein
VTGRAEREERRPTDSSTVTGTHGIAEGQGAAALGAGRAIGSRVPRPPAERLPEGPHGENLTATERPDDRRHPGEPLGES